MSRKSIWQRLVCEAHEYLTDLREIRDDLKSREGWIALGLVIAAVVIAAAWALVSLGFNPANDAITANLHKFGMHSCRPIDNFSGVILFVNMILLLFLTVLTMGNIIRMLGRVKRGWPREPRDLVISASLMLATGIGGIIYMRWIC